MNSKHFVLGGDIKKSLAEGYQFDLKKLFQDAFKVTRKHFLPLLTACLFIMLTFTAVFAMLVKDMASIEDPRVLGLFFVIALLIVPLFTTGLLMMGVHHSIGLKTKSFDLFKYFNIIFKLSLAALMVNLLTNIAGIVFAQVFGSIGFTLSVIVLLYLKMSFCLVYPLIAEKKVPPILALKLSFKLVHKNIGQFTQLLIIFCILFFIGIITSGIGLLFIVPFCVNVMGIIYRQICGVGISVTEVPEGATNESSTDKHSDDDDSSGPKSGGFEA
ncbi:hypothetical protein E2R68_08745 [Psychromonas sp. RZ22]|uniref:hypothetical protein n=1 Tax=Psychromonas algarum TaxID=2555643 RepID=UPI001068935D|nr:hypothetical protein [Psychromonas sp. RZ22]TEW54350.1 hypothetical protein E2R68_08745 [Psychromonas sp. RZ22]